MRTPSAAGRADAVEPDGLDSGGPRAAHVLVEAVADVQRLRGRATGELERVLEDRRIGLARTGA